MIRDNLNAINANLPDTVELIAVSKTKPIADVKEAYNSGHRHFGENKVQELINKAQVLPEDISWHLIGHLQTNKVKHIVSFIHLIHSVDSFKLLKEINKQAAKHNRVVNCLLQFHIAEESSKYGLELPDASNILDDPEFSTLDNINIIGVMGMASFVNDANQIRNEFRSLKNAFDQLKSNYFSNDADFKEISMGMSGDYQLAIEEGSTIIRVGSIIFGHRK
jgi:PLP dependent protein